MPTVQPTTVSGSMVQPAQPPVVIKKDNSGLIKTIVIIIVSLIALTFIVLFVWILVKYNDVSEDVEGQIAVAVAAAEEEKAMELEAEFAEREKAPYRDFAGPVDYGQLSFKYPKTWSLYIAKDAANGGDYEAYFAPIEVYAPSKTTINALRLTIRDKDFAAVAEEYQKAMERKDANLSMETTTVAGVTANRYTGKIPNTDLIGIIVIFKIRDKTAVLQVDSVLFESDFDRLLSTVKFNA